MAEQKHTRRFFLKSASLSLVALGVGGTPPFLGRAIAAANAAPITGRRKTLVTIFQRGAMDGLMAVSPLGDNGLHEFRPRLAMAGTSRQADARLLRLGGDFGMHAALEPLFSLYQNRELAIVHGVGSPNTTRSHFDAQDFMETGTPFRKGTASGWLNRAVGLMGHDAASPFQAVALTRSMPRSLYGDTQALAVSDLSRFNLKSGGSRRTPSNAPAVGFESLYDQTSSELLHDAGGDSFDAIHQLSKLDVSRYKPAADYPRGPLGNALRQIAFLIKSQVGLEVAFAETGGWDTHVQQGTANGVFANRARDLAQSIAAFWNDLGDYRDDVVVMTMTEFGRTVHENGSGGTDHGRASCLFVLGSYVDGGRVHGSVPRLVSHELEDGRDLTVTVDFRSVFAEVAGPHLSIDDDAALFPDWEGGRYPLLRG
jgi:uncharacterized protein (DUF1501 family)